MIKHLLLILTLATTLVGCTPRSAERQPIKVMSFNIRYDNPDDSLDAWPNRRAAIVRMIMSEKPAVLGIQEGLAHQVAFLDSALSGYSYVGVGRDDGQMAGEFAAIFYQDSIFDVVASENVWLSETPQQPSMGWDAVCIRQLNVAELRNRYTGESMLCMNTHFDHVGQMARQQSALMMLDRISKLPQGVSWVLTGDFNCTTADSSLRLLARVPGVFEAREQVTNIGALKPETVDYTYCGFESRASDRDMLDHIYCGGGVEPRSYDVITDNYGVRQLSDHLPVSVLVQ